MRTPTIYAPLALAGVLAACTGTATDPGSAKCGSCASGLTCVDSADFPGGLCTSSCSSSSQCGVGGHCLQLSTGRFCLPGCGSGDACPTGLVCGNAGADGRVCLVPASPPATAVSCPAPTVSSGGTVGPGSDPGTCLKPIVSTRYPSSMGSALSLGTHSPGDSIQFTLPAGTSGFSIVSQGHSANASEVHFNSAVVPNAAFPASLSTPSSQSFYNWLNSLSLAPSDRPVNWYTPFAPLTGAFTFPGSTSGLLTAAQGLAGGSWTLQLDDLLKECAVFSDCADPERGSTAALYDLTVLTRSGGIPAKGGLDLAIYIVSEDSTLTAAAAPNDHDLQRALAQVQADFARAGICLQTVTYYDVPAWAQMRFNLIAVSNTVIADPCSDYRQLFTLAQPGNNISLFLVDGITDASGPPGNRTIGYDGAVPQASSFSGTVAGGAIVSSGDLRDSQRCSATFSLSCGPDLVGYTMAHEMGHALGLFHPTESQGATGEDFDPIVDSPQCLCSLCVSDSARAQCADQQGAKSPYTLVEDTACTQGTQSCGGADYLMFWLVSDISRGNVSPQEGQVMRMNPVVRPL